MIKYLSGIAAVLLFGVTITQQIRSNALSRDISMAREQLARDDELQDKVSALESKLNRVGALELKLNKVSTLERRLNELNGDIASLKANLSSRDNEITDLKTKVQALDRQLALNDTFRADRATGESGGAAEQLTPAIKALLDRMRTKAGVVDGKPQQIKLKDGTITFNTTAKSDGPISDAGEVKIHTIVNLQELHTAHAEMLETQRLAPVNLVDQLTPPAQKGKSINPPKPPVDANNTF